MIDVNFNCHFDGTSSQLSTYWVVLKFEALYTLIFKCIVTLRGFNSKENIEFLKRIQKFTLHILIWTWLAIKGWITDVKLTMAPCRPLLKSDFTFYSITTTVQSRSHDNGHTAFGAHPITTFAHDFQPRQLENSMLWASWAIASIPRRK